MCTLTAKCFKYLAHQKYPEKEIKNSKKLDLYAKELGYKNYNSILPTLKENLPKIDLRLLFPDTKYYNVLEDIERESFDDIAKNIELDMPLARYLMAQVDNELFDEVADFQFLEQEDYIFHEKFTTVDDGFTAKSIQFNIPSNLKVTFSEQTFRYYGGYKVKDVSGEYMKKNLVNMDLKTMVNNGENCFVEGVSSATTEALYYQHENCISKIKDIKNAESISFYVLNNAKFLGKGNESYLMKNFKITMYAFIHYYMRYDYNSSTSLAIELPFSTKDMNADQFHLIEAIIETITNSCKAYEKIFTKPVHLDYSEFDKNATSSYIFFTRKDIDGKISHDFRDTMNIYEM